MSFENRPEANENLRAILRYKPVQIVLPRRLTKTEFCCYHLFIPGNPPGSHGKIQ